MARSGRFRARRSTLPVAEVERTARPVRDAETPAGRRLWPRSSVDRAAVRATGPVFGAGAGRGRRAAGAGCRCSPYLLAVGGRDWHDTARVLVTVSTRWVGAADRARPCLARKVTLEQVAEEVAAAGWGRRQLSGRAVRRRSRRRPARRPRRSGRGGSPARRARPPRPCCAGRARRPQGLLIRVTRRRRPGRTSAA